MHTATKTGLLSGNWLKIIAAVTMLIDHIGYIFFPTQTLWRIIGRIAMPIFAFMIAEGCCYTRSKLRYFLSVLGLGLLCQTVYVAFAGGWELCMPVNFSLSILLVCTLEQAVKERSWLWATLFALVMALVYLLNEAVTLDYGFWGCMLPLFCCLPRVLGRQERWLRVLTLGIGMVLLSMNSSVLQWYSLMALPLLLLYSGQRGKAKMKYFFYIFYPLHLAVLQGIAWLIK
jgi:hypothetical protein